MILKESPPEVSFIIVNYNTDELTINAVKSLFKHCTKYKFEVIIIDNGSVNTNLEILLKQFPDIIFKKLHKNIGFGKANNYGFKFSQGKLYLLIEFRCIFNTKQYLISFHKVSRGK